jgi:hypothetical protein
MPLTRVTQRVSRIASHGCLHRPKRAELFGTIYLYPLTGIVPRRGEPFRRQIR